MTKAPGHQKWPDHMVKEEHAGQRMKAEIHGTTIAESDNAIRVKEDGHPVRYYFLRGDVRMDKLERSTTTTECPFKGQAHYYDVKLGNNRYPDAVWTYEDPYEEHRGLKELLAFDSEKFPEIEIHGA